MSRNIEMDNKEKYPCSDCGKAGWVQLADGSYRCRACYYQAATAFWELWYKAKRAGDG
ncbi:MAG: hypothetical protein JEZ07_06410 [Phycisphaerae bacterium]|nr:hypothetical protein [Phycisphaerae bacterium]